MKEFLDVLFDLTLRGAGVVALVWVADSLFGRHLAAWSRRLAWLVAGFAFFAPAIWPLAVLPPPRLPPAPEMVSPQAGQSADAAAADRGEILRAGAPASALLLVWACGALAMGATLAWRTLAAAREWNGRRFSTDSGLLGQVEDCRIRAGVASPVGVIVSDRIATPALLGWLRPRILLPAALVRTAPADRMRHILLHEFAHHRAADLALGWLFGAVRIVHWFNPAAHLATRRWHSVIEESADERAVRWSGEASGDGYAQTLLALVKSGRVGGRRLGALGISESLRNLKHRIAMIQHHPRRTLPAAFAGILLAALAALVVVHPIRADEASEDAAKTAAVAAMKQWLVGIDKGDYAASWKDASKLFRDSVTEGQWVAALESARRPLGAVRNRKLASALYQTEMPRPPAGPLKGPFVVAQFQSSFENLHSALETVTFERASDGVWRASGYFVAPSAADSAEPQ